MQSYKVLAVTEGEEREVPQSAISSMSSNTTFRVVLTEHGKKTNQKKRAEWRNTNTKKSPHRITREENYTRVRIE
jgi:hypothetical protein